jgi:hypothetical protein
MKTLAAVLVVATCATTLFARDVYVRPHVDRNGTYVEGHHRTAPNRTVDDNYGTRGNYNPYTGETGTERRSYERPYQAPSYPAPSYGQQCGYTSNGRYVCR